MVNLEAPYVDIVDRTQTPRMPWHDIGAVVGKLRDKYSRHKFEKIFILIFSAGASARDISRHFIQRWNAVKLEKARDNQVTLSGSPLKGHLTFF